MCIRRIDTSRWLCRSSRRDTWHSYVIQSRCYLWSTCIQHLYANSVSTISIFLWRGYNRMSYSMLLFALFYLIQNIINLHFFCSWDGLHQRQVIGSIILRRVIKSTRCVLNNTKFSRMNVEWWAYPNIFIKIFWIYLQLLSHLLLGGRSNCESIPGDVCIDRAVTLASWKILVLVSDIV